MEVLLGPVCGASFLFAPESVLPLGTAVGSWTSGRPYSTGFNTPSQFLCRVPVLRLFFPGSWKVHPVSLKNSSVPHRSVVP